MFAANASGKSHVLGHDGNTLGVDCTKLGVLEEMNDVRLSSLLKGGDCGTLETVFVIVGLDDLPDESLEGELAYEELVALLVLANFAECDGTWAVAVGAWYTTCVGDMSTSRGSDRAFAGGLGGELLAWLLFCDGVRVEGSIVVGSAIVGDRSVLGAGHLCKS